MKRQWFASSSTEEYSYSLLSFAQKTVNNAERRHGDSGALSPLSPTQ